MHPSIMPFLSLNLIGMFKKKLRKRIRLNKRSRHILNSSKAMISANFPDILQTHFKAKNAEFYLCLIYIYIYFI